MFPKWELANFVIPGLLMRTFSIRLAEPSALSSTICLEFIPPECFMLIPDEYWPSFFRIYNLYMDWAIDILNMKNIVINNGEYYPNTASGREMFENALQREESKLICYGYAPLKKILMACLGCDSETIIPEELLYRLRYYQCILF